MSVLACTIGSLTLLLAVMSLSAVGAHGASEQAYAETRALFAADRDALEQESVKIERAEAAWSEVDEALASRGLAPGLSLASIEQALDRRGQRDDLARELGAVEQQLRELSEDRDAVETTIEVLESRRETLPILIDPTGLSRSQKPFFVEADAGGITAYRASDDLRYFVPIDALSSGGDYGRYLRRVSAMPGALLVLLVRPDGLETTKRAARLARDAGVRVARLPLPGTGELDWSLIRKLEAAR